MKQASQTITENYLRRLNQEREPVTFKKLSKTQKDDYFFNTSKKSVIQKLASVDFNYNEKHVKKVDFIRAQNLGIFDIMGWIKFLPGKKTVQSPVLFDHTSNIGITVLGKLTQSIEEGRKYEFHNLNLKNFFGNKLSTTPTTTAIVSDEIEEMPILSDDVIKKYIDHEEEINIKLNPKIHWPELLGANLTVDAVCTNDKCGKPVATVPGERIVTCMNGNNTMRVKNFECIFSCVLLFENISLSLPADVESQYFQEDVAKSYQRDKKNFKDMLCFLENVDCTYNSKNNIITKTSDY